MGHLVWTSDLDTGIDVIDGQHRQIVTFINRLYDAKLASNRQIIGEVIDGLVDYTLSHFAFEEALMEDAGYEFSRPHKKVHELFVRRIGEFRLRFNAGEDIINELHGLLARWLFNHIRNDDAAYARTVRGKMQEVVVERKKEAGWLSHFFRRG